jgi:hypothetical protein
MKPDTTDAFTRFHFGKREGIAFQLEELSLGEDVERDGGNQWSEAAQLPPGESSWGAEQVFVAETLGPDCYVTSGMTSYEIIHLTLSLVA